MYMSCVYVQIVLEDYFFLSYVAFLCILNCFHLAFQHRVRLGKYKRDSDSIQKEGENLQAVWSPDGKLIAVLVSVNLTDSAF